MSGGVVALANLPVKTDSNGYLLVTMNGGTATPTKIGIPTGGGPSAPPFFIVGDTTSGIYQRTNGTINVGIGGNNTFEVSAALITIGNGANLSIQGKITTYANVATAGHGVSTIYAESRANAVVTAGTTAASYTVGASDESLIISANVLISTHGSETFNVVYDYTDESNTTRTAAVLPMVNLAGTQLIACSTAGPFAGTDVQIRCKAATTVAIRTTGTFTGGTYNVEGGIQKVA